MSRSPLPVRIVLPLAAIAVGLVSAGFLPMPQPRPRVEPEKPVRLRAGEPAAGEDEAGDRISGGFALFEPFGGRVAALPPGGLRPAITPPASPARSEPRPSEGAAEGVWPPPVMGGGATAPVGGISEIPPEIAATALQSTVSAGVVGGAGTGSEGSAGVPSAGSTGLAGVPPAGVLGYAADRGGPAHQALGRFVPVPSPEPAVAPPAAVGQRTASLGPAPSLPPPVLPVPAPVRVAVHVPLPKIRPLAPLAPTDVGDDDAPDLPVGLPSVLPRPRPPQPGIRVASLGHQPDAPLVGEAEVDADRGSANEADGIAPAGPRTLGEPNRIPAQAMPYLHILRREAKANGVPLWLAVGVGWVESRYQPKLKGSHGVLGLMQVMPATARFQGYRGPTEGLLDPETNIVWGLRELGWAWKRSGGDVCLTVAKYKGGILTTSVSKSAADYCRTVREVTGMNRLG